VSAIAIRVMNHTFVIECRDSRWIPFLRDLWAPVLTSEVDVESPVGIEINGSVREWRLAYGEHLYLTDDPWVVACTIRNYVAKIALQLSNDVVGLHASSARLDGAALLIAGRSGAGKTTLLLDLVDRGWSAAGDDLVALDGSGRVRTWAKPVHVRNPVTWSRFKGDWDVPNWVPPPRTSGLLPPASVRMKAGKFEPGGIVFPIYEDRARPACERLSPAAAAAMAAANCQNVGGVGTESLSYFAGLCSDIPSATLTYGTSSEAISLLEGLVVGWGFTV
jgi:hypothetical protein